MKKMLLTIAAILLTCGAFAQTDTQSKTPDQTTKPVKSHRHANGYIMKDGRMMQVKDGNLMLIEKDITLSNGTVIMADGNYMEKGKPKTILRDGEHVDMDGNVTRKSK